MTNTPDKSEMKAIERVERRLNNAWAKRGFMTLTVSEVRTLLTLARAPSRPPADQVPDMVEHLVVSITEHAIMQLNADEENTLQIEAFGKAVERDIFAALQAVPAASEVGWQPIHDRTPVACHLLVTKFDEDFGEWLVAVKMRDEAIDGGFTHYRPLPEPPALKVSGEE